MLRVTAEGDARELAAFWRDMTETGRVSRSWSTGPDVHLTMEWPTDGGQPLALTAERQVAEMEKCIAELERHIAEQQEKLLDLETAQFIDHTETALDLERWDGRYAAHVAHDLEEVGDNIIKAIESIREGGDPDAAVSTLFKAHMDVCDILADMATDKDTEE